MPGERLQGRGERQPGSPRDGGHTAEDRRIYLNASSYEFLDKIGLVPTPDAVEQLAEVFVPCLAIMCRRGWDPNGGTWRRSGVLGILGDVRKKFERLWERGWTRGVRHDDSGLDLINFVGFYMRSEDNRWGEWGEPASQDDPQSSDGVIGSIEQDLDEMRRP